MFGLNQDQPWGKLAENDYLRVLIVNITRVRLFLCQS